MKTQHFFPSFLLIMFIHAAVYPQNKTERAISWEKIAVLPQTDGTPSIGVAGAINAVSANKMLIAGGANFPGKKPWEGGTKHYSDEIHILQKKKGKYSWKKNISTRLPQAIAYCGNTSTPLGIVYAGGENEAGLSAKAYLIRLNSGHGQVEILSLPNLPLPLTNISLTHIDNVVYAVGGDGTILSSSRFFSLDLASGATEWEILPDLPLALANTLAIAQHGPGGMNIFVVGGRSKQPSGISELSSSLFIYDPRSRIWNSGSAISDGGKIMNFSAGTGVAFSKRYLLITGGDNGEVFHRIETILSQISKASTEKEKVELTKNKNQLIADHEGFYAGILLYDTYENTWVKVGEMPFLPRVTTTAALWSKDIILSNGEVKPGVRNPDIMLGKIKLSQNQK